MDIAKQNKIIIAIVLIWFLASLYLLFGKTQSFGASGLTQSARYNIMGTSAAPLTLSSALTGAGSASSTGRLTKGMPNLSLTGTYTPKTYGAYMQLLVYRSIDDGATYEPYNTLEVKSTDILVHTSGTTGLLFTIPGSGTAASGTAINYGFDLTMVADYVKVAAKEITTSTAGTVFTKIYAQSL